MASSGVKPSDFDLSPLRELIAEAGTGKQRLCYYSFQLPPLKDPVASLLKLRVGNEAVFAFDQPSNGGSVIAGLGQAAVVTAEGEGRFNRLNASWEQISRSAKTAITSGQDSGLTAVGGFSFSTATSSMPWWSSYRPAMLWVPEITLSQGTDGCTVTVTVDASAEDSGVRLDQIEQQLLKLEDADLPMIDPDPAVATKIVSVNSPEHFELAVSGAVERIGAGELSKVVLAREVQVHAAKQIDSAAVFGHLRSRFPDCFNYLVGLDDASFVGASPELLIRRNGQRVSTVALAGTARRSSDPSVDQHLGRGLLGSSKDRAEHDIVIDRIKQNLKPYSLWVTQSPEPQLAQIANVQHLATAVRAQLKQPYSALELAAALHPTPAIGGEPAAVASRLIPALEGLDRGWYTGAVGWVNSNGDGEFSVALRCALIQESTAHCYAGVGVVADSDPQAELAETEAKLAAILPALI